ncbi:MAG: MFS transporter [Ignavibacteriales bacterium]|nr:MFS transporter [Ignavibacteriales bacterium]
MQRTKFTIIFTVLVDIIGFGIVIPILPFYVTSFGASPFTVTTLFSAFAFFAFLSSPFLGALSDKVGRRPVLLASIASTAVGWFVFASATSIPMLFLGRIIDGAAAGNFTVAQSALVDISRDEKDRSANLGLIGATFGIGFMLGPLLGGFLSTVSHSFPFWVAGSLASINTMLAYFFLPETHTQRDPRAPLTMNPLAPLGRAALNRDLRPFFVAWILFGVSFMASQSVFALFAEASFGFSSFQTGLLFSGMGVFTALNQAVLLRPLWLRHFPEAELEFLMTIVLTVALALIALRILPLFYLSVILLASAQSILRVVLTSRVAGIAPAHIKGEVLGIMTSLMAASMVIAPLVAGLLFELDISLPFLVGTVLMSFSVYLEHRLRIQRRLKSMIP